MPQVVGVARRATFKIVYYGPGLAGRTTNVRYIIDRTGSTNLIPGDPIQKLCGLYFDADLGALWAEFSPRSMRPLPDGQQAGFRLLVPPASLFLDPRRRDCLKDVDGLVFVADSQEARFEANIECIEELRANLKWHGVDLRDVPRVLQLNKRDVPSAVLVSKLVRELRIEEAPVFEAVAVTGHGVFECIKDLAGQVLRQYLRKALVSPQSPH